MSVSVSGARKIALGGIGACLAWVFFAYLEKQATCPPAPPSRSNCCAGAPRALLSNQHDLLMAIDTVSSEVVLVHPLGVADALPQR